MNPMRALRQYQKVNSHAQISAASHASIALGMPYDKPLACQLSANAAAIE